VELNRNFKKSYNTWSIVPKVYTIIGAQNDLAFFKAVWYNNM